MRRVLQKPPIVGPYYMCLTVPYVQNVFHPQNCFQYFHKVAVSSLMEFAFAS